jgi:hypothetical protein
MPLLPLRGWSESSGMEDQHFICYQSCKPLIFKHYEQYCVKCLSGIEKNICFYSSLLMT